MMKSERLSSLTKKISGKNIGGTVNNILDIPLNSAEKLKGNKNTSYVSTVASNQVVSTEQLDPYKTLNERYDENNPFEG